MDVAICATFLTHSSNHSSLQSLWLQHLHCRWKSQLKSPRMIGRSQNGNNGSLMTWLARTFWLRRIVSFTSLMITTGHALYWITTEDAEAIFVWYHSVVIKARMITWNLLRVMTSQCSVITFVFDEKHFTVTITASKPTALYFREGVFISHAKNRISASLMEIDNVNPALFRVLLLFPPTPILFPWSSFILTMLKRSRHFRQMLAQISFAGKPACFWTVC